MNYLALKQAHILLAVLSISGFVLRWLFCSRGPKKARHRLARAAPHILDSLLLLSGVLLVMTTGQYPWSTPWIAAKLGGLITYILLGVLAMKSRHEGGRVTAFIFSMALVAWMISVARLKSPLGLLQLVG